MTDTEAIALRANRATERHAKSDGHFVDDDGAMHNVGPVCSAHIGVVPWPCDAASLAADIPELLARVEELEGALRTLTVGTTKVAASLVRGEGSCESGHKAGQNHTHFEVTLRYGQQLIGPLETARRAARAVLEGSASHPNLQDAPRTEST